MAALFKAEISNPPASVAELVSFPVPRPPSARAKLEDMASMCVGYISLLAFISGMALLVIR